MCAELQVSLGGRAGRTWTVPNHGLQPSSARRALQGRGVWGSWPGFPSGAVSSLLSLGLGPPHPLPFPLTPCKHSGAFSNRIWKLRETKPRCGWRDQSMGPHPEQHSPAPTPRPGLHLPGRQHWLDARGCSVSCLWAWVPGVRAGSGGSPEGSAVKTQRGKGDAGAFQKRQDSRPCQPAYCCSLPPQGSTCHPAQ